MFNEKDQDNISIPMKKNNYIFILFSQFNQLKLKNLSIIYVFI